LPLGPFSAPNVPSDAMIAWALAFCALLLAIALLQFRRRPL
jgi:hypothetical protein